MSEQTRFPVTETSIKNIENAFTYHEPNASKQERYIVIREKAKELALLINTCVVDSREKSLALTTLQTSVMWANVGIACNI